MSTNIMKTANEIKQMLQLQSADVQKAAEVTVKELVTFLAPLMEKAFLERGVTYFTATSIELETGMSKPFTNELHRNATYTLLKCELGKAGYTVLLEGGIRNNWHRWNIYLNLDDSLAHVKSVYRGDVEQARPKGPTLLGGINNM